MIRNQNVVALLIGRQMVKDDGQQNGRSGEKCSARPYSAGTVKTRLEQRREVKRSSVLASGGGSANRKYTENRRDVREHPAINPDETKQTLVNVKADSNNANYVASSNNNFTTTNSVEDYKRKPNIQNTNDTRQTLMKEQVKEVRREQVNNELRRDLIPETQFKQISDTKVHIQTSKVGTARSLSVTDTSVQKKNTLQTGNKIDTTKTARSMSLSKSADQNLFQKDNNYKLLKRSSLSSYSVNLTVAKTRGSSTSSPNSTGYSSSDSEYSDRNDKLFVTGKHIRKREQEYSPTPKAHSHSPIRRLNVKKDSKEENGHRKTRHHKAGAEVTRQSLKIETSKDSESDDTFDWSSDEERKIEEIFLELDADNDGVLSFKELRNGAQLLGWNPTKSEVAHYLKQLDKDGDEKLSRHEFRMYCKDLMSKLQHPKRSLEESIEVMMKVIDTDGDGLCNKEEFRQFIQCRGDSPLTDSEVEELFSHFDADGDKTTLNKYELLQVLTSDVEDIVHRK